ncbi:hypothetical protein BDF14DRAFT_1883870 [Spinellus fusiger]|nr:hypothetical protein BDF14DRAFT_1883870 [Spinellus fusiger]
MAQHPSSNSAASWYGKKQDYSYEHQQQSYYEQQQIYYAQQQQLYVEQQQQQFYDEQQHAYYEQQQAYYEQQSYNKQSEYSHVIQHLHQQTQSRHAVAAAAAASIKFTLGTQSSWQGQDTVSSHYQYPIEKSTRSMVDYDDLASTEKATQPFGCKPDGIVPANAPKIRTEAELAAWIAARKKNWPSQANVERKIKEAEERTSKGELPKEHGKRKRKPLEHPTSKRQHTENDTKTKPATVGLVAGYRSDSDLDSEDSEDDIVDPERDAISSKDPSTSGRIAPPEPEKPQHKKVCKFFARGLCKRGDNCLFSHEKQERREPLPSAVLHQRPNLLRRLLSKEILQEKNTLLQCFRYITDNHFFQDTTTPTTTQ